MIRTTKVTSGTKPYDFNAGTKHQCTWYAYWRVQEEGFTPPTYLDKKTKSGKYPNAKYWLDNNRDDWEAKDINYKPIAMDIVVCTGTSGHVFVIELDNGDGTYLCSDYNRVSSKAFASFNWKIGSTLSGCGKVIGYLHCKNNKPSDDNYKVLYEQAQAKLEKVKDYTNKIQDIL